MTAACTSCMMVVSQWLAASTGPARIHTLCLVGPAHTLHVLFQTLFGVRYDRSLLTSLAQCPGTMFFMPQLLSETVALSHVCHLLVHGACFDF